jgi:hypothetical protein
LFLTGNIKNLGSKGVLLITQSSREGFARILADIVRKPLRVYGAGRYETRPSSEVLHGPVAAI